MIGRRQAVIAASVWVAQGPGARPAELPIEQPARLECTVNQRTARGIGLTLPAGPLLRATRVIA